MSYEGDKCDNQIVYFMRNDMRILLDVCHMLDAENIDYWIDDGTVLGLVRDNSLIQGDGDIDIGVFSKDVYKIDKLEPEIEKRGYTKHITTYKNGERIKVSFRNDGRRPINIKAYYVRKKFAWYPTTASKKHGEKWKNNVNPLLKWISYKHHKINKRYYKREIRMTWPIQIINFNTRVIPLKYLNSRNTHSEFNLKLPSPIEEYMLFRFGKDWTTSDDDWYYMDDDGSIIKNSPEQILPELEKHTEKSDKPVENVISKVRLKHK